MAVSMRTWAEEPIANNDRLNQFDEVRGVIGLDNSAGLPLNRYGFAPGASARESGAVFAPIVEAIFDQVARPASWLLAWKSESGPTLSRARVRFTRATFDKDGWQTVDDRGVALSRKVVTRPSSPPGEHTWRDGAILLIGPEIGLPGVLSGA